MDQALKNYYKDSKEGSSRDYKDWLDGRNHKGQVGKYDASLVCSDTLRLDALSSEMLPMDEAVKYLCELVEGDCSRIVCGDVGGWSAKKENNLYTREYFVEPNNVKNRLILDKSIIIELGSSNKPFLTCLVFPRNENALVIKQVSFTFDPNILPANSSASLLMECRLMQLDAGTL